MATIGPNELQQRILLGASYVQMVVHTLNDRFLNLPIFNAANFFNPRNYPNNDSNRSTNTELWLERMLLKFQYTKEKSNMCKGELLEFIEILQHECENKPYLRLGVYVVAIWNGVQIGLNVCHFGKKIILILSNIAIL